LVATEFAVIARYKARAGAEDRVAAALAHMTGPSRNEPGNLDYQVLRDPHEPGVFMLFERYRDETAFRAHLATDHFATWLTGQVLPNLDERTRFDLVPLGPDVREPKA
jgi:quinol monooxygenase YgiN